MNRMKINTLFMGIGNVNVLIMMLRFFFLFALRPNGELNIRKCAIILCKIDAGVCAIRSFSFSFRFTNAITVYIRLMVYVNYSSNRTLAGSMRHVVSLAKGMTWVSMKTAHHILFVFFCCCESVR